MDLVAAMELRVKADQAKAALAATKGAVVDLGAASKATSVQGAQIGPALAGAGAKAAPAMVDLTAKAKVLGAELGRVSVATADVGARSFAAGGGARMLGQQLSQVAQQGAVTGNYLGALAVQLPNMALGFGGVATAASIVATIVIPALINMFSQSEEKAKDVDAAMGDLSQALSRYDEFVVRSSKTTAELKTEFGEFADQIRGFSEYMQGVSLGTALRDMDAAIEPLKGGLVDVVDLLQRVAESEVNVADTKRLADAGLLDYTAVLNAKDTLDIFRAAAKETAASLGLLPEQALQLSAALDGLGAGQGIVEIRDRAAETLALLKEWYPAGAALPPELSAMATRLDEIMSKSAATVVNLEDTVSQTKTMVASFQDGAAAAAMVGDAIIDTSAYIASAAGLADGLAGALGRAALNAWDAARGVAAAAEAKQQALANAQLEIIGFENSPGGVALGKYGARGAVPDRPRDLDGNPKVGTARTSSGSGGAGGGGAARGASASLASLQAEAQAALAALDTAIAAINEKVKLGLLSTAEGTEAVGKAKERAGTAIAELIPKLEKLGPATNKVVAGLRATVGGFVAEIGAAGNDLAETLSSNFESGFVAFISGAKDGKAAMADFGAFVLAELARIAAQKFTSSVISPLLDSVIGSIFPSAAGGAIIPSATGNVISGPGIAAYSGSIVDRPTFFPMAKGAMGLMGEAGPEAVVPLARGPGGVLGIRGFGGGEGGGGNVIVNVQNSGPQTKATATSRQQGNDTIIDVMLDQISDRIGSDIQRGVGPVTGAMNSVYGLNRLGS